MTVAILIVLELAARCYLRVTRSDDDVDSRVHADGYRHASWVKEYFREYNDWGVSWHPYVYWVGEPYKGQYVNVNSEGIRHSWSDSATVPVCKQAMQIFMFGGSTMWGVGSRDDYTIPSWLQRMLDRRHLCAEVTNLGQDGYVSTQEVLFLAEQIRSGRRPNLVIFYDGYNDILSAALNGVAGVTYDESARRLEFNINNFFAPIQTRQLLELAARRIVLSSGLAKVAGRMSAVLAPKSYRLAQDVLVRRPTYAGIDRDVPLEGATVRDYLANVATVEGMARAFGFRCLFYWQPCILDKGTLTAYEQKQEDSVPSALKKFISAVEGKIAVVAVQNRVRDVRDLFSQVRQPYFIDEVHITEQGNRLVAERMLPDVLAVIEEQKPVSTGRR
jgi:lysophospholipase L1-like esterase